jgi:glycosyltransferase involved in cell wall biosynthesis
MFDLAAGLRQLGHEVLVASRRDAHAVIQVAHERQLEWWSLASSVRTEADVWHLHLHNSLDARALPLLAARRALARGAVVMTEHLPRAPRTDFMFPANLPSDIPHGIRKPGAAIVKPLLKRGQFRVADAVITVSRASAEFIVRRWQADPRWLTTIHNGVAVPPTAPPLHDTGEPMRVVAIAQLNWLKGLDVLLESAARAREPWSVRIVGDGPARASLGAQASQLPPWRQVEFTGWRSDAAGAALEGDVVCAPSRAESFSYVVLEAMACARPVVAATVDGAGEAIRNGEHGLLVPPEDPDGLADALDGLARDPERRARMGRAAYERVADEFALTRMVSETAALYVKARAARVRAGRARV